MVINSSGKSPFEICDSTGKEFKEIYDNVGNLLFKNWNELQGGLPLTFGSHSDYLKDYCIYGNTIQDGTPAPENPAEVVGCGERTENLFDKNDKYVKRQFTYNYIIKGLDPNKYYTCSTNFEKISGVTTASIYFGGGSSEVNGVWSVTPRTFKPNANGELGVYIRFARDSGAPAIFEDLTNGTIWVMVNKSEEPLPYAPYGYKIPVMVSNGTNSVTTPVYVGSEPLHKIGDYADYVDFKRGVVVRRIKKVVFTGNETFLKNYPGKSDSFLYYHDGYRANEYCFCTHLVNNGTIPINEVGVFNLNNVLYFNFGSAIMYAQPSGNITAGLKEYLVAQYEVGTPVTVWYVLAKPKEEPLENLLPIQTIKGTNILTADTTVQPSEMYIKYKR